MWLRVSMAGSTVSTPPPRGCTFIGSHRWRGGKLSHFDRSFLCHNEIVSKICTGLGLTLSPSSQSPKTWSSSRILEFITELQVCAILSDKGFKTSMFCTFWSTFPYVDRELATKCPVWKLPWKIKVKLSIFRSYSHFLEIFVYK